MSVDFDNSTVTFDANDPKDVQLSADFLSSNKGFSGLALDSNKGSSLYFQGSQQLNDYRSDPPTGGVKLGLDYNSGSADIGGADFSIGSMFLGFDCTDTNFYVGGEFVGPGFSSNANDHFGLNSSWVNGFAYFGLKDGGFGCGAFVASGEISGDLNISIPFSNYTLTLTGSLNPPGSIGCEIRAGSTGGQSREGLGAFGWGVGYRIH